MKRIDNDTFVSCGAPVVSEINNDYKYLKISPVNSLTNGVGFGIIDNRNRLVVYFNKSIRTGESTDPIYFMLRKY